jgi:hypothetical protein
MLRYINGHYVGDAEVTDMTLLGWHFLRDDCRLQFSPHTLVEPGQTLTVEPPLEMCRHGLHASMEPLDALLYAPGTIVCRVELSGKILQDYDKMCAEKRTVLWMADATTALHEFMAWCAADMAERLGLRDVGVAIVKAKKLWLHKQINDRDLCWLAAEISQMVIGDLAGYMQRAIWRALVEPTEPHGDAVILALQKFIRFPLATAEQHNAKLEELLLGLAREQNIDNQEVSINE